MRLDQRTTSIPCPSPVRGNCEQQSLTEAAESVGLTKSAAVSKRLAALEEQIGAPLLKRGGRVGAAHGSGRSDAPCGP